MIRRFKISQHLVAAFRPPFHGLAAIVWLYFAWCFLVHPHSLILRGAFPDPDDYMILTHTLDWLKGQSWFDMTQLRLDPPDGVPLHFSRLTELPLAGLIEVLRLTGLGWIGAATIAAAIWPLVLLAGLLAALRELATSFMPRDWTGATAYVALFTTSLMYKFTPGHVDHHGLIALITTLAFICAARMTQEPEKTQWAFGLGLFLAIGQAVALEILPWLLIMSAFVWLLMMVRGRVMAHAGLIFGATIYLVSLSLLFVLRSPSDWFDLDLTSFSVVYVLLAGGIGLSCASASLVASSRYAAVRWFVGILAVCAAAFLFVYRFPELATGPYGAIHRPFSRLFFLYIVEAMPLLRAEASIAAAILRLLPVLFGLGASVWFLVKAKKKGASALWGLTTAMLATSVALTTFYQSRFMASAMLFSIVPITFFLRQSLAWAAEKWRGRKLAAAELGLILLAGPLLTVLLPATADGRAFNTGVLLFPVPLGQQDDTVVLETILNHPVFADRPRLIMNTIDEGAELLFRTPHKFLAAPYHGNISGNLDSFRFFSTRDVKEAKNIAKERQVEAIVVHVPPPPLYTGRSLFERRLEGEKEVARTDISFAERLAEGKDVPKWLKPFDHPLLTDYRLYEVVAEKPPVVKAPAQRRRPATPGKKRR